ncbi:MAG: YbhB/YbcL family Raf kinase inhibitor-like protein [Bdellovibrionaceae bacterium]|nr:YbhB/YbcL family Raf kinase inhibitor-like protein [Pseudobdellovibrionaceae bacterium]
MISLQSSAFQDGATIPPRYTQEADNISPPLEWSGVSPQAQELALICEDPDAPGPEPYVHWIIYGMNPRQTRLEEGFRPLSELHSPLHAFQGRNSAGLIGYIGPMPPVQHDWHHYHFKLFALKKVVTPPIGASRDEFYAAIQPHVVEQAELIGRYHRTKRLQEFPNWQPSSPHP